MFENIKSEHKEKIIELIEELLEVWSENNWLTIKKYIVRYSHPDIRKYFSTRHHYTKKHTLNDFEKDLIDFCKKEYNIEFVLRKEDTHHEETQTEN